MREWLINKNLCLEWHLKRWIGKDLAVRICMVIDKALKRRQRRMTFEIFQERLKVGVERKECHTCGGLFAEEEGKNWQGNWICNKCLSYDGTEE